MLPPTPAEFIGAGPFAIGDTAPDQRMAHPIPFARGESMGQHLAVERLIRIVENRLVYLVNNLSRKWSRRMCWACGNKYSPNSARCCTYCGRKLEDLRFLMTSRWDSDLFTGFEALTRKRIRHFGLLAPVYAFYRNDMLMAVYHYDGGALLLDYASPLPATRVLRAAIHLCDTLSYLHHHGVVLRDFGAQNVLIMPNGSPRLFDIDAEEILTRPQEIYQRPDQPAMRDTQRLARLFRAYVAPQDEAVLALLDHAESGRFPGPIPFQQVLRRLLEELKGQDARKTIPHAAAYSDLGLYRAHNEDRWAWRKLGERVELYAVADAMGGLSYGAEAAESALATFQQGVVDLLDKEHPEAGAVKDALTAALRRANDTVYRDRKARRVDMGTTLTAALVVDDRHVFFAHAGDSSAWLLRGGKLQRLTAEHTVAAELLADKQITEAEFADHKARHILTVAIGMEPQLEEVDFHHLPGKHGDRILLCSDGLSGEVTEDALRFHLQSWADRQKAVRELVREAYAHGGHDNLTLIVLDLP